MSVLLKFLMRAMDAHTVFIFLMKMLIKYWKQTMENSLIFPVSGAILSLKKVRRPFYIRAVQGKVLFFQTIQAFVQ